MKTSCIVKDCRKGYVIEAAKMGDFDDACVDFGLIKIIENYGKDYNQLRVL